jgi:hypothetical protein
LTTTADYKKLLTKYETSTESMEFLGLLDDYKLQGKSTAQNGQREGGGGLCVRVYTS